MILILSLGLATLTATVAFIKEKLRNPEKTWLVAVLNVVATPLRWLHIPPFDPNLLELDKAMQQGMKAIGLYNFEDTNVNMVDMYQRFKDTAFYKSLDFTNVGIMLSYMEVTVSIQRKLELVQYLKDVPQVLQVPVKSPVFVIGMGRSGTTLMHRLLSLDPAVRSPKLWELLNPVPALQLQQEAGRSGPALAQAFKADRDARIQAMRSRITMRRLLGDSELDKLHELGAELPEECIMAMSDGLPMMPHVMPAAFCNPDMLLGLPARQVQTAYASYRKLLQLLSYQTGDTGPDPARWLLKSPVHTYYLAELIKSFPDAKFVWAHRHPVTNLSSMCALVRAFCNLYYTKDCFDAKLVGQRLVQLFGLAWNKGLRDIEQHKLDCAHVIYDTLVADPVGTVKNIYKQFDWEFTSEYEKILTDFVVEDKRKREALKRQFHGTQQQLHAHRPEDFELTYESIMADAAVASYYEKFRFPEPPK